VELVVVGPERARDLESEALAVGGSQQPGERPGGRHGHLVAAHDVELGPEARRRDGVGLIQFVEVGQAVDEDTVIGIVEVMKLMNTVRSGVTGVVTEVCADNAVLVEFGQPLVRVREAGA
jgi:hypothetical protein